MSLLYVSVPAFDLFLLCYWWFSLGRLSGEQGYAASWRNGYFILLAWAYLHQPDILNATLVGLGRGTGGGTGKCQRGPFCFCLAAALC
jgi:hypothetical protein